MAWRPLPRWIRVQDVIWLLLFCSLPAVSPVRHPVEIPIIVGLAVLQLLEPKIPALAKTEGNVISNLLKLLFGYLLMGYTGGVNSSYYLILLLPVLSAATTLGAVGTVTFTVLACASYLSFLFYVDWDRWVLPPEQIRELGLRVIFLAVFGFLTYRLAESRGEQARKLQSVAEQLSDANRSLQEAEAAVRRSERLAALGQLSAGLAHELRNPLGTIRASAEMLRKNIPEENAMARELTGFIAGEVDRTNSLVSRFLEFARPLEPKLQQADLSEVIDRAVARLERDAANHPVSVHKNYSPDIPPFPLDAELMEGVIYNLALNAAQATAPGGAITVKTRPVDDLVELSVIDRGSGIDPKHLESIFNPFFTTKADGVGLGLAIVSKIVDAHGGKMAVESELGKGTVFRVFLPGRRTG